MNSMIEGSVIIYSYLIFISPTFCVTNVWRYFFTGMPLNSVCSRLFINGPLHGIHVIPSSPWNCMQHLVDANYSSIAVMIVTLSTLVDLLGLCWMTSSNYDGLNRSSFSRDIKFCLDRQIGIIWCLISTFDDYHLLFIVLLLLTHVFKLL